MLRAEVGRSYILRSVNLTCRSGEDGCEGVGGWRVSGVVTPRPAKYACPPEAVWTVASVRRRFRCGGVGWLCGADPGCGPQGGASRLGGSGVGRVGGRGYSAIAGRSAYLCGLGLFPRSRPQVPGAERVHGWARRERAARSAVELF